MFLNSLIYYISFAYMIYISHRGFVDGNDSNLDNNPDQIESLIRKNIDVEIDVRFYKNKFYNIQKFNSFMNN